MNSSLYNFKYFAQMRLTVAFFFTGLMIFSVEFLQAQNFNKRYAGFSRSKLIYVETEDGTKIEGYLGGFKKDEGLITMVKLKDKSDKKLEFTTSQIKKMYLYPSSFSKVEGLLVKDDVVNNWGDDSVIDTVLIKQGYVLFEKIPIKTAGKRKNEFNTKEVMLQLVNPHFSKKMKVYDNPNTDNSGLINVGGISVVKGGINSYYIRKVSEGVAYKLYSWDYSKKFSDIFGDSPDFMETFGKSPLWIHFERDVYQYTIIAIK